MKIRQRQKGEPITVETAIPLFSQKGDSELTFLPDTINLKIVASEQDWATIFKLSLSDPEHLGNLIFLNAARPVYEKFLHHLDYPSPRGIHSDPEDPDNPFSVQLRRQFLHEARTFAAAAYAVISHWRRKIRKQWPDHFRWVVEAAEAEMGHENLWSHNETLDTVALLKFLVEQRYKQRRIRLGLKNIDELNERNFWKFYLQRKYIEPAKQFFKRMNYTLTIEELCELM